LTVSVARAGEATTKAARIRCFIECSKVVAPLLLSVLRFPGPVGLRILHNEPAGLAKWLREIVVGFELALEDG
jgi:hypothetical protein